MMTHRMDDKSKKERKYIIDEDSRTGEKKLNAFRVKHLPEISSEISKKMISGMERADERTRNRIHRESERTVPEEVTAKERIEAEVEALAEDLRIGLVVSKQRIVPLNGDTKSVIEKFEIEEKLSSKDNISGDVWLAKRYWDDDYYGHVVLKTPKVEHRNSKIKMRDLYDDIKQEWRNLRRFKEHPNILSPSGESFVHNAETVIQTEYQPWGFSDYLLFFREEHELTAGLMSAAIQCLDAIAFMAETKDDDGLNGYAHVDFKRAHIRLDYRDGSDGNEKGWDVILIDLDSILPVGSIRLGGLKYNPACVDPEKFMKLHDTSILTTIEPSETVYSLALSLMYSMAARFQIRMESRSMGPVKKMDGLREVLDTEKLGRKILGIREIDERNLLRLYYTNKFRRVRAGKFDQDPDELRQLIEKHSHVDEIRKEALSELRGADRNATVHPYIFVGLLECLKPYVDRHDPRMMQGLFEQLLEDSLR